MVIENEYKKAFKEVLVVLDSIPQEDLEKIPDDIITTLKTYQEESYKFELDFNKDFANQNISLMAKAILANFYKDYWVSDTERKVIEQKENIQRAKIEEEKSRKYNAYNIFK